MSRLVEVYCANDVPEAYLIKHMLEENGIKVGLQNENLQSVVGGVPVGIATQPRLMVFEESYEQARSIIQQI